MTVAEEFGIGHNGRQGMTQIVRNGTGHASDRGKLLGLQQVALTLEKAGAHAVEGAGQLRDFVPPARIEGMMEVSTFQGSYTRNQAPERAGERVRDEKHQSASHQNRRQAQ